jgi:hypothetical protein
MVDVQVVVVVVVIINNQPASAICRTARPVWQRETRKCKNGNVELGEGKSRRETPWDGEDSLASNRRTVVTPNQTE